MVVRSLKSLMNILLEILKGPLRLSRSRVEKYGAQYKVFGIFGVINYVIPYFMWSQQNYNDDIALGLRIIAGGLCVPLIFSSDLWGRWGRYLPLYWHLTLVYCLPFFTTYMLLSNGGSTTWLMNMSLALFLLALVVDWLSFFLILSTGVFLGWGFYTQITGGGAVVVDTETLYMAVYMYTFATLIGFIFSRNRQLLEDERYTTLKTLGGVIAHEMRTPLIALSESARSVQESFTPLLDGYKQAQQAGLPVQTLPPHKVAYLKELPEDQQTTIQGALSMIDMFLMNLKPLPLDAEGEVCSIQACVDTALEEYPFFPNERQLIHWDCAHDFNFRGNSTLIKHVLFNLLKNAIYYVRAANKGEIHLWTESSGSVSTLYVKDTGSGIAPRVLPRIFDRFYTQTRHGTGIGLPFCKLVLEGLGGGITCDSVEGEYTLFALNFPNIRAKDKPALGEWSGLQSF